MAVTACILPHFSGATLIPNLHFILTMHLKQVFSLSTKNQGFTKFITRSPWAMVLKQSKGATKGLRVINYIDP